MSGGPLVVIGDVLLDREVIGTVERLCPEAPVPVLAQTSTVDRPGGAGLAALLAADHAEAPHAGADQAGTSYAGTSYAGADRADPREVVLVAAFGDDSGGERLRELLAQAGVRVIALPLHGPTVEKIRMRAGEHLLMRLDRGDGGVVGRAPAKALAAIQAAGAVLVSDYGRGVAGQPQLRAALAERARRVPVVWDPHPNGAAPVPAVSLVTPNSSEAARLGPASGCDLTAAMTNAERLRRYWSARAVTVTMAARGAVLADGVRPPTLVPAPLRARGDSCGAGDRFASAAVAALADGMSTLDAVVAAVTSATAFVAAGGALALIEDRDAEKVTEKATEKAAEKAEEVA
jgi:bifunctional ADP-heptose synthase (sugar kinase/adenylyltransferase)